MATTVQTSPKKEHDAAKLLKRETANAKKAVAAALANLTKSRNALRKLTDRSTDDVGRGDVNAAVHVVRQRSIAYREAHAKLIGISTPKLRAKEQARLLDNEDGVEGTLARAKAWLELRAVDDRIQPDGDNSFIKLPHWNTIYGVNRLHCEFNLLNSAVCL
ncbi:hypothetical protein CAPTEDRAFT_186117 [Capitella teleta]|uniref:Uncharacterized protein n=1 Tax=Capitella teleta TaxID=283909 RepID=R7VII9_CAPTE|nr:hypothetical protein CAPTEDRAFT_186117 [Capitella teleta]|eukprot:ELU15530.1 hypothetical protein CAPTEDRAFT_186117 [Capitella teleta]